MSSEEGHLFSLGLNELKMLRLLELDGYWHLVDCGIPNIGIVRVVY